MLTQEEFDSLRSSINLELNEQICIIGTSLKATVIYYYIKTIDSVPRVVGRIYFNGGSPDHYEKAKDTIKKYEMKSIEVIGEGFDDGHDTLRTFLRVFLKPENEIVVKGPGYVEIMDLKSYRWIKTVQEVFK